MIEKHLNRTKFHFSVGILLLLATLISGVLALKRIPYISMEFLEKEIMYVKYHYDFSHENIAQPQELVPALSVPVLVFHGLADEEDNQKNANTNNEGLNMTRGQFWDQMLTLKKNGWQTINIEDFEAFLQGKKQVPNKSFLLTFDDGRRDSFYNADPILQTLGFNASLFVITNKSFGSRSGSTYYLSENELEMVERTGRWSIQSHGKDDHDQYSIDAENHQGNFLTNKLWKVQEQRTETEEEYESRINSDLEISKNEIEGIFHNRVIGFAYPFSDYGDHSQNFPEVSSILRNAVNSHYSLAFYQTSANDPDSFNHPWQNGETSGLIKRIKFPSVFSGEELLAYLNTSAQKTLPFTDDFNKETGWRKTWGSLMFKKGEFSIGASDQTTGGAVFLAGSGSWPKYTFSVLPKDINGESVTLVSNYVNDQNYLECTYTDKFVRLAQTINGKKEIIFEQRLLKRQMFDELGIARESNTLECLLGDQTVLSSDIMPISSAGLIGIKTWDKEVGKSTFVIEKAEVK
jgi:peptidoglycan/xylan/chitin deacetylase (PgdA/CDA1 family)